jgi:LDH2 family malate/lactate/ureidoglycolate dehydrogenase
LPTSSTLAARYRLDDLRRLASALVGSVGVAPARSTALASHLLWFDAVGASSHGIASLPGWLDRLDRKEIDAVAEGRAGFERAGTAVFDARNGLPPLALETAAGIASEKARDVGIGIVRVRNLGETGPAAPVAASLAIGPFVAIVAGPGASLTIALPTLDGLPVVHDSRLGEMANPSLTGLLGDWSPWVSAISGGEGWIVLALSVTAFESLAAFHERVAASFDEASSKPGRFSPKNWEVRRREARERGVVVDEEAILKLKFRANRLGVAWPAVVGG